MGAPRQLLCRQDVDEHSARDKPSGEVGEEQYFKALVARLPKLCVKWKSLEAAVDRCPNSSSNGGYMSDGAYVYDTGPVFTGIRCTCIGEDRMRM